MRLSCGDGHVDGHGHGHGDSDDDDDDDDDDGGGDDGDYDADVDAGGIDVAVVGQARVYRWFMRMSLRQLLVVKHGTFKVRTLPSC
eukprot:399283-Rhodomonas_salina.4